MIILGVDPGSLLTGYGIIRADRGTLSVIACGTIRNKSVTPMPERLNLIFGELRSLIRTHHPDEFAIETAFYGKNAQSALKLGQARGAAILAAVTDGIAVHEYSPREVKKAIVGNGTASKAQVKSMIMTVLAMKTIRPGYDTPDALAIAVCHFQRRSRHQAQPHRSWKSFLTTHPERLAAGKQP
jgi:crossover junction endodeoxyribonuclease RuvC